MHTSRVRALWYVVTGVNNNDNNNDDNNNNNNNNSNSNKRGMGLTWLKKVDHLVENGDQDKSDEGKVPVDDEHDGHANGRTKQSHPRIVQLEGGAPTCEWVEKGVWLRLEGWKRNGTYLEI